MTLNDKIAQVVRNLKQGTEAGKVRWATTIDDGFITSRPESSIVIKKTQMVRSLQSTLPKVVLLGQKSLPPHLYRIVLADSNGTPVAALNDDELPEPRDLIELYELAANTKAEELAEAWLR